MKITFFEVPKEEQDFFIKALEGHEVVCFEDKLNEENISLAKDAEVDVQKIIDDYSKRIDDSIAHKEKEIMTI